MGRHLFVGARTELSMVHARPVVSDTEVGNLDSRTLALAGGFNNPRPQHSLVDRFTSWAGIRPHPPALHRNGTLKLERF